MRRWRLAGELGCEEHRETKTHTVRMGGFRNTLTRMWRFSNFMAYVVITVPKIMAHLLPGGEVCWCLVDIDVTVLTDDVDDDTPGVAMIRSTTCLESVGAPCGPPVFPTICRVSMS